MQNVLLALSELRGRRFGKHGHEVIRMSISLTWTSHSRGIQKDSTFLREKG